MTPLLVGAGFLVAAVLRDQCGSPRRGPGARYGTQDGWPVRYGSVSSSMVLKISATEEGLAELARVFAHRSSQVPGVRVVKAKGTGEGTGEPASGLIGIGLGPVEGAAPGTRTRAFIHTGGRIQSNEPVSVGVKFDLSSSRDFYETRRKLDAIAREMPISSYRVDTQGRVMPSLGDPPGLIVAYIFTLKPSSVITETPMYVYTRREGLAFYPKPLSVGTPTMLELKQSLPQRLPPISAPRVSPPDSLVSQVPTFGRSDTLYLGE